VEVRWCQIRAIGRMGKNLRVPNVQVVLCRESNLWPGTVVQQQYSKLKRNLRGISFSTDEDVQQEVKRRTGLQDVSFYLHGFDTLMYSSNKCLNRCGDYVEK
jgi:hypothetical protein